MSIYIYIAMIGRNINLVIYLNGASCFVFLKYQIHENVLSPSLIIALKDLTKFVI